LSRTFSRRTRVVGEAVGSFAFSGDDVLGVLVAVSEVVDAVSVMIH
jgi:hypothetical protein